MLIAVFITEMVILHKYVFIIIIIIIIIIINFYKIQCNRKWILSPNGAKSVFCMFLRKEAVSGQTNCSPFSFSLGPIFAHLNGLVN